MKKCYSLPNNPAYYRMCSTDVYCSKQTGSSSTKKPSPIISSFQIGRENTHDDKICGGAENVVKVETSKHSINGLLGFITLGIYTPLEAHNVYCSQ